MTEWDNSLFLTFDLDWACDEILEDTIQLVEESNVAATFFVTHDTPLLSCLRSNKEIELGIHPNFNSLLNGQTNAGKSADIIKKIKEVVPEARSVRCHSLVQSSHLLDSFVKLGLTHDVNLFIPAYSQIKLLPFRHYNGLIRVPYLWEDDYHCAPLINGEEQYWDVGCFLDKPGLKVFDFHPIHVYLNTEDLERYELCREYHRQPNLLYGFRYKNNKNGTRVFLVNLIKEAKQRKMRFGLIKEVDI